MTLEETELEVKFLDEVHGIFEMPRGMYDKQIRNVLQKYENLNMALFHNMIERLKKETEGGVGLASFCGKCARRGI